MGNPPLNNSCHGQKDIPIKPSAFHVDCESPKNHPPHASLNNTKDTTNTNAKGIMRIEESEEQKLEVEARCTPQKKKRHEKQETSETICALKPFSSHDLATNVAFADSQIKELCKSTISTVAVQKNEKHSDGNILKCSSNYQNKNLKVNTNCSVQTATKSNIIPVRVQRKRTKGFNLQKASPNGLPVIYVGRPTKWGNPWKMTRIDDPTPCSREEAIQNYERHLRNKLQQDPYFLDELRGKDLACWCPLKDKNGNPVPCHADVIIKIMKERDYERKRWGVDVEM